MAVFDLPQALTSLAHFAQSLLSGREITLHHLLAQVCHPFGESI
jgi:hypothetical protein